MNKPVNTRNSERGGAGVKFLMVVVVLLLLGNAGYQFIPLKFNAENLKQDMQTAVVQGLVVPGKVSAVEVVKQKIYIALAGNNIPPDAFVEVKQANNVIQAHVTYSKNVPLLPFGIYNYHYEFDHIATPTGFLTKQ